MSYYDWCIIKMMSMIFQCKSNILLINIYIYIYIYILEKKINMRDDTPNQINAATWLEFPVDSVM